MTNQNEFPDTIICEDVFLEKISPLHLEEMYEVLIDNSDYLVPWMPFVDKNLTLDKQYDYIDDSLSMWNEYKRFEFSIYDKKEDLFLGIATVDVKNLKTGIYELGYWIREDFKGKGIISDVVTKLTEVLFNEYSANKIIIKTIEGNVGSIKVALKSGFLFSHKEYCQSFINDEMVDDLVFIKLKDSNKTKELEEAQKDLKRIFCIEF